MCFTAYLRVGASYRAFCVFQDSLLVNDLPELLSSGLKQIRHLKWQKVLRYVFPILEGNTKGAILVVTYERWHTVHTW